MSERESIRGKVCFSIVNIEQIPDKFCVITKDFRTANLHLIEIEIEEGCRSIPGVLIESVKEHRARWNNEDD